MAAIRDAIIVVDIEATCWFQWQTPPDQRSEIIEVGVARLDAVTMQVTDRRTLLVTPTMSVISPFCTELTTITPELVAAEGIPFADACARLVNEFDTRTHLWASWGAYDRRIFIEQCKLMNLEYPFGRWHLNVKNLFSKFITRDAPMPLSAAMQFMNLEMVGTPHRGGDDAYNTARLLGAVLERFGTGILKKYWSK